MKILENITNSLWRFFSSLKLAIGLFISLAVSTMAGSIILQKPIAEPGQLERVYSVQTLHWFNLFGLLDVFHSWWYVLQLALLAVNLTVVSADMWPRFFARIRSFSPLLDEKDPPEMRAVLKHKENPRALAARLAGVMKKRFRRPRITEKDGKIYLGAESAKYAHLGVYVIHAGIVLILIGGMITGMKGFEGQIQLAPGEEASSYIDRKIEGKQVPLGFEVRCHKAWMKKYPDGSPKAYFSNIDIVDNGRVVASKTIKVNDPLTYKGIYFYQATFGQKAANERTSVTLEIEKPNAKKATTVVTDFNKLEKLPGGKGTFEVVDYAKNIPLNIQGHRKNLGEAVKLMLSEKGEDPHPIWLFKNYPDFDRNIRHGAYHLVFKDFKDDYDVVPVTGIQVARNPSINVTWTGAVLLMAGLLATFFIPHRKLWFVVSQGELLVAAASHRHPETFGRTVRRLVEEISKDILSQKDTNNVKWSEKLSGGLNDPIPA